MRNRYKLLTYGGLYLVLLCIISWGMYDIFDLEKIVGASTIEHHDSSVTSAAKIVLNNLKNLLGYIFLFPVYPFLVFLDCVFTAWSIAVSSYAQGLGDTFILLLPHGILEIPNFIVYSFLSLLSFREFYKRKGDAVKCYKECIMRYGKYYIATGIFVVIAGIVEGLVTPFIWKLL